MGPRAGLEGRKSLPHMDSIPGSPRPYRVAVTIELPGPQFKLTLKRNLIFTVHNISLYGVMTQSADHRLFQHWACHITVRYWTECIVCLSSFPSTVFSSVYNAVLIAKSLFSCKLQSMRE